MRSHAAFGDAGRREELPQLCGGVEVRRNREVLVSRHRLLELLDREGAHLARMRRSARQRLPSKKPGCLSIRSAGTVDCAGRDAGVAGDTGYIHQRVEVPYLPRRARPPLKGDCSNTTHRMVCASTVGGKRPIPQVSTLSQMAHSSCARCCHPMTPGCSAQPAVFNSARVRDLDLANPTADEAAPCLP